MEGLMFLKFSKDRKPEELRYCWGKLYCCFLYFFTFFLCLNSLNLGKINLQKSILLSSDEVQVHTSANQLQVGVYYCILWWIFHHNVIDTNMTCDNPTIIRFPLFQIHVYRRRGLKIIRPCLWSLLRGQEVHVTGPGKEMYHLHMVRYRPCQHVPRLRVCSTFWRAWPVESLHEGKRVKVYFHQITKSSHSTCTFAFFLLKQAT